VSGIPNEKIPGGIYRDTRWTWWPLAALAQEREVEPGALGHRASTGNGEQIRAGVNAYPRLRVSDADSLRAGGLCFSVSSLRESWLTAVPCGRRQNGVKTTADKSRINACPANPSKP
jgi:hypothetical protein